MSQGRGLVIGTAGVLAALAVAVVLVTREPAAGVAAGPRALTVAGVLGASDGGADGFARALEPRPFHFPEDYGPHPDFRAEWWYWTGNLETADGRAFGYQFTLFRSALTAQAPARGSAWGSRQVFMGHFTLTDVRAGRFHAAERFSRAAVGLAGATATPFHVWLQDWEVRGASDMEPWPMYLRAQADGVALALTLEPGKPAVAQGDRGLSQKGPEQGNASYYYSFPRMPSRGTVTVGSESFAVTGDSWMDREWSTSALGAGQVGWDWFSLQLSDGSELMEYQLRREDGTADPYSAGLWIPPTGEPVRLTREDVKLEVLDTWRSPRGATYPSRWRVQVPKRRLDLTVTPRLADQELVLSFRYWEGAVSLEGTREGQPVKGRGYVELTGYADARVPGDTASR
ncbi:carotenoid 1,2-hydratase [Corallococcus sp. H22C18031201]|nr:carotenoid 1,2-hydratase [Corallococcus sp. H22C18031201]